MSYVSCGFLVFFLIRLASGTSFNQPKLSSSAEWARDGKMLPVNSTTTETFDNIFIDNNNTIYVAITARNLVLAWRNGDEKEPEEIFNVTAPTSVFATSPDHIYIAMKNGEEHVVKRFHNNSDTVVVTNTTGPCASLFIDHNNTLYCSLEQKHRILMKQLDDSLPNGTHFLGKETKGSQSDHLDQPKGIFVARNFSLYVADYQNSRIQMFLPGSVQGITVAKDQLNLPTDVVLGSNEQLFILDSGNFRILRIHSTGSRCLVGCILDGGPAAIYLKSPFAFSFDIIGNIYVADGNDRRIQKFNLTRNDHQISYNLPKLCPSSIWNPHGSTILDNSTCGKDFWGIFVDINNHLYVNARGRDKILVWRDGRVISNISTIVDASQTSIFVTSSNDIYIDSGNGQHYHVQRWTLNNRNHSVVMNIRDRCNGLFVDVAQNIYCVHNNSNHVLKRYANESINNTVIVAGNITRGSDAYLLDQPLGIFVTEKFDLYVADCGNNRVQLFRNNQRNGTTVAGTGANDTIDLYCPASIILDGDRYLFISDYGHHRIVGSGPNGFRCIIGCTGSMGSRSDQLMNPSTLNFDRDGNIFVVDYRNGRVQKFHLVKESNISYNQPRFCCMTISENEIEFLNETSIGSSPTGLFIDKKDLMYLSQLSSRSS